MKPKTSSLLEEAQKRLAASGFQNPKLESEVLLSHSLSCERIDLYKKAYDFITETEFKVFEKNLQRRLNHEPMAHILGHKDFCGHRFYVTKDTLIPRPESELLVEEVSFFLRSRKYCPSFVDLGTGTGCLGISLALNLESSEGILVDLSASALEVAKRNLENFKPKMSQIFLKQSDVLSDFFWSSLNPVDAIISNPPYIGHSEKSDLECGVLDFEPHLALFAKEEGLEFYRVFSKKAKPALKKSGRLFLELSPIIYRDVVTIFQEENWTLLKTIKDYAGHKRHIVLGL